MSRPIRPDEVGQQQRSIIPEVVFDTINELIAVNWDGRSAVVKQEELVARICSRLGCLKDDVFKRKLLNFEEAYRAEGWSVDYDKPGYNETYSATFTFHRKRG
jgi:hypothetical protein